MAELFGKRVRRLRIAAGLSQVELGKRLHVHSSRINQIERTTGHKPTFDLARSLDRALNADDLLVELWPYVYREAFPDWAKAFMSHEAKAIALRTYMAHTVDGLLQTEEYARALLRIGRTLKTEEQLKERLEGRMSRQERLRGADGPELWVILDEAVLWRPVGGVAVMRGQLARLLETEGDPRITLQVLPFDCGEHPSLGSSLTVLTLPKGSEVAYLEGGGHGWLIEDAAEVKRYALAYDWLRANALPPAHSLDLIRSMMEGQYRDSRIPSRTERRRLAQVQLQRSGGRSVHRGGRRVRIPDPRSGLQEP
jgi:transcriptional regulator with XRE-family HTH domain